MSTDNQPTFEEFLGETPVNDQEKGLAFTTSEFIRCWIISPIDWPEHAEVMGNLQSIKDSEIRPQFLLAIQTKIVPILQQSADAPPSSNAAGKEELAKGQKENVQTLIDLINTAVTEVSELE